MIDYKDNQAYVNQLSILSWAGFFDTLAQIKLINKLNNIGRFNEEEHIVHLEIIAKIFIKAMYEYKLMVDFNWVDWKEGEPLIYKGEFEQFDTHTLFKMLTFIIKFDSGKIKYLLTKFEDNTILEILTILERRICKV